MVSQLKSADRAEIVFLLCYSRNVEATHYAPGGTSTGQNKFDHEIPGLAFQWQTPPTQAAHTLHPTHPTRTGSLRQGKPRDDQPPSERSAHIYSDELHNLWPTTNQRQWPRAKINTPLRSIIQQGVHRNKDDTFRRHTNSTQSAQAQCELDADVWQTKTFS